VRLLGASNEWMSAGPTQRNIEAIVKLEQEFLEQRTFANRLVDQIVDTAGTMTTFVVHGMLFIGWILVNVGLIPGIKPFDPFPFILLTMTVSMEGVILALFVLMKQNRMSRRADERDHLHLQVNLLAEKEVTKMLQMQSRICEQLGVRQPLTDPEVKELSEDTAVDRLARDLKEKLPE
jgi:uncharacterized membrane protein